jgi:hypothetical protein
VLAGLVQVGDERQEDGDYVVLIVTVILIRARGIGSEQGVWPRFGREAQGLRAKHHSAGRREGARGSGEEKQRSGRREELGIG